MNRKLLVLAVIAVVAIALAAVLVLRRAPEAEGSLLAGPLVPGLAEHVNDVEQVRMVKAGDAPYLTLQRGEEGWTIAERDGYPADPAKVRLALINLGESRVLEPKTSNPERYAQLGVQDLDQPGATGTRIEVTGGGIDAALIVGNRPAQGGEGTYVRRVGEAASVLATGDLVPDPEVGPWLRRDILDIPSSAIREIEITVGDGTPLRVAKASAEDANFTVQDVRRGREVQSDVVANGLGSMLSGLTLDDVARDREDAVGDNTLHRAVYRLFDGRIVTLEGWQQPDTPEGNPGKAYARVSVVLDEAVARENIAADIAREQSAAASASASASASAAADAGDVDGATEAGDAVDAIDESTSRNGAEDGAASERSTGDDAAQAAGDGNGNGNGGGDSDSDATSADGETDGKTDGTVATADDAADSATSGAASPVDAEAEIATRLDALKRDTEAQNARLQGWLFEIPAYKFANVDKTLDDMLKPRG